MCMEVIVGGVAIEGRDGNIDVYGGHSRGSSN